MSEKDRKKSVKFGKTMMRDYDDNVWTDQVAFYFDGVNFTYKRNPKDQALAPRGRSKYAMSHLTQLINFGERRNTV